MASAMFIFTVLLVLLSQLKALPAVSHNGKGIRQAFFFPCNRWRKKSAMSAKTLEVSLLGVGTVLRLERDAWLMVK